MGNTIDCEEKGTLSLDGFQGNGMNTNESMIEPNVRIPQSSMWNLQHSLYTNLSCREWEYRRISSGLSSSSYLAKSYANLIVSYMNDRNKQNPVNSKNKILILDVGAGHGRLGYLIIHFLLQQQQLWPNPNECPFLYVMTDCSQKIVDWWKQNEFLKSYIEKGYLDVALYDVEKEGDFYLQNNKVNISMEMIQHPPIIILNGVLSCLQQDVIKITQTGIIPGTVSLSSSQKEFSKTPSIIPRLLFNWRFDGPSESEWGFDWDHDLRDIIHSMRLYYPNSVFVIPTCGVQFINHLLSIFNKQCIFLISDKGVLLDDELKGGLSPQIELNGDIQMPVNFSILKEHSKLHNGWCNYSSIHESFRTLLFVYGIPSKQVSHLRLSFHHFFISQSFSMINAITSDTTKSSSLSLHLILELLRLTQYDHDFLLQVKQILQNTTNSQFLSRINIHDLIMDLTFCKDQVFPVEVFHDTCFDVARMFMLVEEYQTAADLFLLSNQLYGEHHASWFNRGICLYRLNQTAQARFCFFRTLELNYEYEEARKYLKRIDSNCHYKAPVITHLNESTIEKDNLFISNFEKNEQDDIVRKDYNPNPAIQVIDELEFPSDDEEFVMDREEEYIRMEQKSDEEFVIQEPIPDKDEL